MRPSAPDIDHEANSLESIKRDAHRQGNAHEKGSDTIRHIEKRAAYQRAVFVKRQHGKVHHDTCHGTPSGITSIHGKIARYSINQRGKQEEQQQPRITVSIKYQATGYQHINLSRSKKGQIVDDKGTKDQKDERPRIEKHTGDCVPTDSPV
jgi:hypothetical protein